ncbi:alpha/beta fold hydrolase [Humidesulfovibrio sp.]
MRHTRNARALALFLLLAALLCACARTSHATRPLASQDWPQARTMHADGLALDYIDLPAREAGTQAPPLLLLTGYAVTKEMWDQALLHDLRARRRVLVLDNRGMGQSAAPAGAFALRDLARDAAALLDGLGIAHADVLGWSMGGMTAQELALLRPDLVRSLTLLATVAENAELMPVLDRMAALPPAQLLGAMFPPGWAAAHPDAPARLPARPRPPNMDVITRQYAAMKHWTGTLERLPALRMPVLVLAGGQDWVCRSEQSRRIAAAIPGARLEVMHQGGHWMMHQEPEALARLVEDFLAKLDATPATR